MTIGVYGDFRIYKYTKTLNYLLKNGNKIHIFGQKKIIDSLKISLIKKNIYFHKFSSIVSNNLNIYKKVFFFTSLLNNLIVVKNFIISFYWANFLNLKILLVSDDRSPDILLSLIYHCKKKKIKVILIPSGIFSGKTFILQNRINFLNNFMTKKPTEPKNFFIKYKKKYISFYRNDILAIYKFLKILPKDPWVSGSNVDGAIFLDSNSKNYYLGKKFKNYNIYNLPSVDKKMNFFEKKNFLKKKNIFFKKNKMNNKKKILIFSPTPWYEHNVTSFDEAAKRHNEICDIIKKAQKKRDFLCLISLHPKQNYEDYKWISDKYNFQISKSPLRNIIAYSNLYLLSYESDTMFWAANLKIPCVIFNAFREKTDIFESNDITFAESRSELFDLINKYIQLTKTNNILKDNFNLVQINFAKQINSLYISNNS
jgi:hypothetical protein